MTIKKQSVKSVRGNVTNPFTGEKVYPTKKDVDKYNKTTTTLRFSRKSK